MIKLLLIGDRHNTEMIPSCRIDDFAASCAAKDDEIIEIAKLNNVSAILQPGDFWTDADHKLKNDFIAKVANKWNNIFDAEGNPIPLVGIFGNHDLIGENLSSYQTTTMGLLNALDIFKIVSIDSPYYIKDGDRTIAITGTSYHKGMDKPEFISDYIVEKHLGDTHIHIVHGMLTPRNLGKVIRHTKIENILDTKADITFSGHDHIGYDTLEKDGKLFINPGAVVRLSAEEKEINRSIHVVLLTIDKDKITYETIPLKSALPGNVVIDRSLLDEKAELEAFTEAIKENIKTMDIGNSFGMEDILDEIYKEKKIPENIKKDIAKSLNDNILTSSKSLKIANTGTSISKVHLVNFQSHSDTTLSLDSHFNVILGESCQGKSAVLRAIRWVIENKPSGKSIMKIGTDNVSVELTLENGTIIKRFISGKENGYKIFLPDGTVETGNTKMVSRVQEIMGYSNFNIDENTSITLNMLRQGEGWYIIGDKYSSTDRARILGALKNTNAADAVIREIERENLQIQGEIKKSQIDLANSELEETTIKEQLEDKKHLSKAIDCRINIEKINDYNNLLESLKKSEEFVNKFNTFDEKTISEAINKIKSNCVRIEQIKKHIAIISSSQEIFKEQENILNKLPDENTIKTKIQKFKELLLKREKIVISIRNVDEQNELLRVINHRLDVLDVNLDNKYNHLKDSIDKYLLIKQHYTTVIKSNRTAKKADEFINSSTIVDTFNNKNNELTKKIEVLNRIVILRTKIELETQSLKKANENFTKIDKTLDSAIESKIKILTDGHICPTCHIELTEERLQEILPKIKGDAKND